MDIHWNGLNTRCWLILEENLLRLIKLLNIKYRRNTSLKLLLAVWIILSLFQLKSSNLSNLLYCLILFALWLDWDLISFFLIWTNKRLTLIWRIIIIGLLCILLLVIIMLRLLSICWNRKLRSMLLIILVGLLFMKVSFQGILKSVNLYLIKEAKLFVIKMSW